MFVKPGLTGTYTFNQLLFMFYWLWTSLCQTGVDKAWLQNLVVANQVFSGKLQNKVITYKSWFTSWCVEKNIFWISDGNINSTKNNSTILTGICHGH